MTDTPDIAARLLREAADPTTDHPGQRVRDARAVLDWTQQTLAEQLDLSIDAVARWERGEREPASRTSQAALLALADDLDSD